MLHFNSSTPEKPKTNKSYEDKQKHISQQQGKHNPESSKIAKEKAIEYIRQSAQLKELLLLRAYANEEK